MHATTIILALAEPWPALIAVALLALVLIPLGIAFARLMHRLERGGIERERARIELVRELPAIYRPERPSPAVRVTGVALAVVLFAVADRSGAWAVLIASAVLMSAYLGLLWFLQRAAYARLAGDLQVLWTARTTSQRERFSEAVREVYGAKRASKLLDGLE